MHTYMAAAGRHGIYRDDEFRERRDDEFRERREFANSKGERERIREGSGNYGRGRILDRNSRDKGRVRQKDIKEREFMNGGYRSASSKSDSGSSGSMGGPRRSEFPVRALDREPGELSSESGSDEAIDSVPRAKDNHASKLENGTWSPLHTKKRKFSPIVWDRDDRDAGNLSKSGMSPATTTNLPPPPPLPKSYLQSPNPITSGNIHISPPQNTKIQISEPSPLGDIVRPFVSAASESPVHLLSSSLLEPHVDYNQAVEKPADEDYAPTRNIRSSRWANDANSPVDEGEISDAPTDNGLQKRRKKISLSASAEVRLCKKSLSPELGELKIEGSEGTRSRSSESEEGFRGGSSCRDDYPDSALNQNDHMEIDGEQGNYDTSPSQADTDSEDDFDARDKPAGPPQRCVNMLHGCRSVDEFERLNKIDEGTYGVVYRARDNKTGEIVALKKVKMEKEREGFPLTSLREINILLSFHHSSIVDVKEVVVGSNLDSIFMVMEYMEHDLKALMETMKQPFSQSEVKCLMLQLLEGVKYLHDNWVLHRDLKTSNLLLNNRGDLKICDFGLARQYGSPSKPYTHLVVTLWYRAPELLLGAKQYSTAIDMWSLGCIMAELLSKEPLFNGRTEVDQLDKIFRTLGTPNETIWPGFSKLPGVKVNFVKHQYNLLRRKFPATSFTGTPVLSDAGFDLLNKLLTYDPEKRITAEAALSHEWFREVPLPKSKDFMPTFPAQHAQDRRMQRIMKSPDPLEEQRRKELQQGELGTGGLFG
ncbi:hypothetical protein LguiA_032844 [Lonicera macranthoides]